MLTSKAGELGIEPTQFWRTIKPVPFQRVRHRTWIPPLEDPGRAILLAAAFCLMRGVSPYLLIWIGTLASIPVIVWILWEARASRVFLAGSVFVALCVSSPFLAESLSLPHSAVGFYLIGALLLVAVGLYGFLGADRSLRGFVIRAAVASLAFAFCCTARGSTLAMAPAFVLALLASMRRVAPHYAQGHWVRQCVLAGVLGVVFLAPYLMFRPAQHHNFWMGLWQGLGDYASDRGYSWHDRDLKRWLVAHGRKAFPHPRHVTPDDEAFMRETVFRDVRADPLFLGGVFGRRFVDTVSLAKLAPYGPLAGYSIEPPPLHYKYTTPADWLGFGSWSTLTDRRRWTRPHATALREGGAPPLR